MSDVKRLFWVVLAILPLACSKPERVAGFDPNNLDQLIEIYARSNYFNDTAVFDRLKVTGKDGVRYTEAIVHQSSDTVRWQKFLAKVEVFRKEHEGEYASQNAAPDSGT